MDIGYFSMTPEGVLEPCPPDQAEKLMEDEDSLVVARIERNGVLVSTAFIPICLMFDDGAPQAFETVVVRGHKSQVVSRYSDLAEALSGHDQAVARFCS